MRPEREGQCTGARLTRVNDIGAAGASQEHVPRGKEVT